MDLFREVNTTLVPEVDPHELLERLTPSLPSPTIRDMAHAVHTLRTERIST